MISGLQMCMRVPKAVSLQMLATLRVIAEELGNGRSKVNKETGFTPDSWDVYEFSDPRGSHFPIHRIA